MTDWLHGGCEPLFFSTPFAALQSIAAVQGGPLRISVNQSVEAAQALRQSSTAFVFDDVNYHGLQIAGGDAQETLATDYAGILPDIGRRITFWSNGAGYLDGVNPSEITVIDLKTLHPDAPCDGAMLLCEDAAFKEALKRYASLGVQKAAAWNTRVETSGIAGLMAPLVREYWEAHLETLIRCTRQTEEIAACYREQFSASRLLEPQRTRFPRFFPLRLIPELYCPKEDIYLALRDAGIDITVPFKPLSHFKAFETPGLKGSAEFYKAVLALPVHGVDIEKADSLARQFLEVIDRYAYRGCSF